MTSDAWTFALVTLAAVNLLVLAGLWLRGSRGDGGAHERRHAETLAQMERLRSNSTAPSAICSGP